MNYIEEQKDYISRSFKFLPLPVQTNSNCLTHPFGQDAQIGRCKINRSNIHSYACIHMLRWPQVGKEAQTTPRCR